MVKAKLWIKNQKIVGVPKLEHFSLKEEELPTCKEGEIILEAEYLSVDPYMRYRLDSASIGSVIHGSQVGKVIESKNENYPVGCRLIGYPGWRTHTHLTRDRLEGQQEVFPYSKLPDVHPYTPSAALGVLGMPGNTAYFGLLEICDPKPGEVVLVNGAAGAVGSLVCQIAKIKGAKVIAFAGSQKKVEWLKELGIQHVFNYKTDDISKCIQEVAPEGINCYFDNVGGDFSLKVLPRMALFGRVAICGAISVYNKDELSISASMPTSPYTASLMLFKQLRVEGFLVSRWSKRWTEGIMQMKAWLDEGKIKFEETVTEGFDEMPGAFIGLFKGDNIGKAVIKV